MTQRTFIDLTAPEQYDGNPLAPVRGEAEARARSSDAESSHAAAKRMNDTGATATNTQRAIDAVWKWPGRSSKELAKLDGSLDRHEFGRRLPDAEALGEVHRRKVDGKRDLAWFPGRAE